MARPTIHVRRLAAVWLLAALALGMPRAAAQDPAPVAPVVVTLAAHAELGGLDVLVRDLGTVESPLPELTQRIADLRVAPRPARGFARTFERAEIERCLLDAGLPPDAFLLSGNTSVVARPITALIDTERVREVADGIAQALLTDDGRTTADVEWELDRPLLPAHVPPGRAGLELRGRVHPEWSTAASLTVDVEVVVDGAVERTIPVTYRLRHFATVLVPVRGVRRGETLSPTDVAERRIAVPAEASARLGYAALGDLDGKVAGRNLVAGRPLRIDELSDPAVVLRNDPVKLISRRGRVQVAIDGIALEDGALGARIRVQNLASHRAVEAVVQGPGLCVVPTAPEIVR
ncbi:MAG: flagellar basal body P-ring formation protein FlgA [Planctomycetes bacterium]|nr:flagellar basal body P-ring formation protein FlgA [Planctomycetota bacterium]